MRRLLILVLATATGCTIGGSDGPEASPVVCAVRFAAPSGFAPAGSLEQDQRDHVGLRLDFADPEGRELHVFAGIPGEFGEGLPAAGRLELTEGRSGLVAGRGEVWVVTWDEEDLCDPRSVLASGFSRRAFVEALAEMGLAPAD
ncbi:MAG: hypothetical protein ACRDGW_07195 [Actinomycetota bacterium]